MKVFISHSFEDEDRKIYEDLSAALVASGIRCWDPDELPVGNSLRDKLRSAIDSCSLCVFIATRNSLHSGWCNAEVGAFWGLGKTVIVYLADTNVNEDELPVQFKGDIYSNQQEKILKGVKQHLDQLDPHGSAPIVRSLEDPVERMEYIITMHDRSKSLFTVSTGYDISDYTYYTKQQTNKFLTSVRNIILDQQRSYVRYQDVSSAPQSWLRFMLESTKSAPNCHVWFINAPDPTLFRARMMQIAVSDDINNAIGKVTYLNTSIETGANYPYALQIRHRGFADAFEGQVGSYYQELHRRYGIDRDELVRQLDLDDDESRKIIDDCVNSEFETLLHQDEDDAVLTVVRRTNSLDHDLIRKRIRDKVARNEGAGK